MVVHSSYELFFRSQKTALAEAEIGCGVITYTIKRGIILIAYTTNMSRGEGAIFMQLFFIAVADIDLYLFFRFFLIFSIGGVLLSLSSALILISGALVLLVPYCLSLYLVFKKKKAMWGILVLVGSHLFTIAALFVRSLVRVRECVPDDAARIPAECRIRFFRLSLWCVILFLAGLKEKGLHTIETTGRTGFDILQESVRHHLGHILGLEQEIAQTMLQ